MRVSVFLALAIALSSSAPTVVRADGRAEVSVDRTEEARQRFRQGVTLYREGAFRAALIEFQRAYEIKPNFALLSNIGQTQLVLGDYLAASNALRGYLDQGGSEVPPDRREKIEKQLESLQQRIAELTISVNQLGAEVFLDGERVGISPLASPLSVNVGRHVVLVRSGENEDSKVVDVAGGDARTLDFQIEQGAEAPPMPVAAVAAPADAARAAVAAPANVVDAAPVAQKSGWSLRRKIALGSLIAAGTFAAGTAVVMVLQNKEQKAYDDALNTRDADPNVVAVHQANAWRRAVAVDILGGLTLAAAGTGLTLWFMSKPDRRDGSSLRVGVSGSQVLVRGGF